MTTRIRFSLLFTALLATASLSAQQTDSLLSKAYDRDQAIRIELARLGKAANTGGYTDSLVDSLVMLSEEMERIDSRNLRLVDSILRDGIPVGLAEKSYDAIWIIIDHAPLDVQKKRLPMLKRAAKEGFISPNRMATLSDRIAMREGRRQRFGTQSHRRTRKRDGYSNRLVFFYLSPIRRKIKTLHGLRMTACVARSRVLVPFPETFRDTET